MEPKRWCFQGNQDLQKASSITIGGVLAMLRGNLNKDDPRPLIPLGHGDPSCFPSFKTASAAVDAIVTALQSHEYNSYAPIVGVLPARRAIADHLNRELPYKLLPDDVYLTVGCRQAIEISLSAINRPGANILLPRPGFPTYEAYAASKNLEVRRFDLLPDREWEVDLDGVEALADENTVAMVIINPGNPCGNVFSYDHLKKVAETARTLGILVIADEVYDHLTFGTTPFVPMGVFGSIVPVLTLGAISKRWLVPGWRLGWIVTTDPNGILKQTGVVESITSILNISQYPATFIQGAVPQIIENTKKDFFTNIIGMLSEAADICCNAIDDIPCITCPKKPEGGMFVVVKLNLTMLEGINDDIDFCMKLANEENVLVLPGAAVGMKNHVRITFACELSSLEDGLARIKAFCKRHTKVIINN